MSKENRIATALATLCGMYGPDRQLEPDARKATVAGLMWARADAVEQACAAAAMAGNWTKDKTLLRFVTDHLPEEAAEREKLEPFDCAAWERRHVSVLEWEVAHYKAHVKRQPERERWQRYLVDAEQRLTRATA